MEPIVIYRGDSTDAFSAKVIRIVLKTDVDLTNATARFELLSFAKNFTNAEVLTKTFTIAIPAQNTKAFPIGNLAGRLTLFDSSLRVMTASCSIPFRVKVPGGCSSGRWIVDNGVVEVTVEMGVDYSLVYNKPAIGGVEVSGDKSLADYGIASSQGLSQEISRATAAESAISSSLSEESSRAQSAEASISSAITAEKSRAEIAEAGLGGRITTETARAQQAESQLESGKVDKVAGKGLSTNDFTTALKNKLEGIDMDTKVSKTSFSTFDGIVIADTATQKDVRIALQSILEKLKGLKFVLAVLVSMASCSALSEVTRETNWEDVPPDTKIGTVVDLGRGGGGISTNAVMALVDGSFVGGTNAVNAAVETVTDAPWATPADAGEISTNTVADRVAPWAMKGQPQPTTDLTPAISYTTAVSNKLEQAKQDTLVSGTNIKTLNKESLLGSGNISLVADLTPAINYTTAVSNMLVNTKADKATTLAGYGITDGLTQTSADARYLQQTYPTSALFYTNVATVVTNIVQTRGEGIPKATVTSGGSYPDPVTSKMNERYFFTTYSPGEDEITCYCLIEDARIGLVMTGFDPFFMEDVEMTITSMEYEIKESKFIPDLVWTNEFESATNQLNAAIQSSASQLDTKLSAEIIASTNGLSSIFMSITPQTIAVRNDSTENQINITGGEGAFPDANINGQFYMSACGYVNVKEMDAYRPNYMPAGYYVNGTNILSQVETIVAPTSNVVFNAETYFSLDADELALVSETNRVWQSSYELTNYVETAAITLYSGQIAKDTLTAVTNVSLTLKFPKGTQSAGDAILRLNCLSNSVIGVVSVDGASAYHFAGAADWQTLEAGTNIVTFTKSAVDADGWEIWVGKQKSGL